MKPEDSFIAIGETIKFNNVKAIAVDAGKKNTCKGCIFYKLKMQDCPCSKSLTNCYYANREDHKSIEFHAL